MTRGRSIDKTLPPSRALTQQRDYRARKAHRTKTLEDDNARLLAENEALRAQVAILNRRLGEIEQKTGTDHVAWQEVEEFRSQAERALRRLDDLVSQRPKSASETPYQVMPATQTSETLQQNAIRPGTCCGDRPQRCAEATSNCSMVLPSGIPVSVPPVYTEYDSRIVEPHQQMMPYVQLTRQDEGERTNWARGYPEPELPSFRPDYPQSNEREECCLGLISCEPTLVPE